MRQISVGIVGYGNLGKAVEKVLKNSKNLHLEAIFSKRDLRNTVKIDKILDYKAKIKILFLCGGSQNELEKQAFENVKNFHIVECYDNHSRLKNYIKKIDKLAKENKKIALSAFGWDPGLFSFMRGLFDGLNLDTYTFWGKGLSQGHTQAIKNIDGVVDAVQFTIPNEKEKEKIKRGKVIEKGKNLHSRLCFVVAPKEKQPEIKTKIVTMKDYFEGYQTQVKFVTQKKLDKIKTFSHRGEVLSRGNVAKFSLNLPSNPDFTASVAVLFANCIEKYEKDGKFGAFTIFDIPLCDVLRKNKFLFL